MPRSKKTSSTPAPAAPPQDFGLSIKYLEYFGGFILVLLYYPTQPIRFEQIFMIMEITLDQIEGKTELPCFSIMFVSVNTPIIGMGGEQNIQLQMMKTRRHLMVYLVNDNDPRSMWKGAPLPYVQASLRNLYHALVPDKEAEQWNMLLMKKMMGVKPGSRIAKEYQRLFMLFYAEDELGNQVWKQGEDSPADRFIEELSRLNATAVRPFTELQIQLGDGMTHLLSIT